MNENISPFNFENKLLRADEVAEILNISKAFAYQLMQTGELPTVHLGRSVRVRPSDLEEVIRSNTYNGSSK